MEYSKSNPDPLADGTSCINHSYSTFAGDVPSVPLARAGGRKRQRPRRPHPGQLQRRLGGLQQRRGRRRRRLLDLLRSVSAQLFVRVLPAATGHFKPGIKFSAYVTIAIPAVVQGDISVFSFSCSTVCPVLLGPMGIWQMRLCSWSRWWKRGTPKSTQPSSQSG